MSEEELYTPSKEQTLIDASTAVTFFTALLDQKIPIFHAVSMTNSYLNSLVIARKIGKDKPDEPWKEAP